MTPAERQIIGADPRASAVLARITLPCRAATTFSGILDRTVTCLEAQDALPLLRARYHAQRSRDSALRSAG